MLLALSQFLFNWINSSKFPWCYIMTMLPCYGKETQSCNKYSCLGPLLPIELLKLTTWIAFPFFSLLERNLPGNRKLPRKDQLICILGIQLLTCPWSYRGPAWSYRGPNAFPCILFLMSVCIAWSSSMGQALLPVVSASLFSFSRPGVC